MTELRDAATVIILRPTPDSFEVFMLRRHGGHEFMANAWVFPGGALDGRDLAPQIPAVTSGLDPENAARWLGVDDNKTALGLCVAAIRETFEESGLLLAHRSGDSAPLALDDPEVAGRINTLRRKVDDYEFGMVEVCRRENLVLDIGCLGYMAHWITPHFETRRYDTYFFVAPVPPKQIARHDDGETTHSAWWSPTTALSNYRDRQILLAPPTIRILEELQGFSSIPELMNDLDSRSTPPAILPHPVGLDSDEMTLLLPGDPDYPANDAQLSDASPVASGITRMVRRDGQWFSIT